MPTIVIREHDDRATHTVSLTVNDRKRTLVRNQHELVTHDELEVLLRSHESKYVQVINVKDELPDPDVKVDPTPLRSASEAMKKGATTNQWVPKE